jgi:hypothetical protein
MTVLSHATGALWVVAVEAALDGDFVLNGGQAAIVGAGAARLQLAAPAFALPLLFLFLAAAGAALTILAATGARRFLGAESVKLSSDSRWRERDDPAKSGGEQRRAQQAAPFDPSRQCIEHPVIHPSPLLALALPSGGFGSLCGSVVIVPESITPLPRILGENWPVRAGEMLS